MTRTDAILEMLLILEQEDPWLFRVTCEVIRSIHQNLGNKKGGE